MAITALRQTHIQVVNEVERLLNVDTSTTLSSRQFTRVLLRLLNELIDELADHGDWQELYDEILVTASSSVEEYEVHASGGLVQHIEEISFSSSKSPLEFRTREEIRRLNRGGRSHGIPRNVAVIGVNASSGNPLIRVQPIPGSNQNNQPFRVCYYQKPNLVTTSDTSVQSVFPANLLIQGLYAKALLEENGGEPSGEYQTAYANYLRMRDEAYKRFTADSGTDIYFVPGVR